MSGAYEAEDKGNMQYEVGTEAKGRANTIVRQWYFFSLCFTTVLSSVIAAIPLAAGTFGKHLGNIALGTFYGSYTITAMVFAIPMSKLISPKVNIIVGLALYSMYSISYFIGRQIGPHGCPDSSTAHRDHWPAQGAVLLVGMVLSGIGAGIIWPAQQTYFSRCVDRHHKLLAESREASSSKFAGIFASTFLSMEVICKLLSTFVQYGMCANNWDGHFISGNCKDCSKQNDGQFTVFCIYASLAVLATLLTIMVPIPDPETEATDDKEPEKLDFCGRSLAAGRLMFTDPKVMLLSGINFAFAAGSSFVNSYVTTNVIGGSSLGSASKGVFVAIIPAAGAIANKLFPYCYKLCGDWGKIMVCCFGMLCFFFFALPFLVVDDPVNDLGKWSILPFMFVMFGVGRGVYEGTNKAIWTDMFKGEKAQPAFSNISLQNGIMTTLCYYSFGNIFGDLSMHGKAVWTLVMPLWAIIGTVIAFVMWRRGQYENVGLAD